MARTQEVERVGYATFSVRLPQPLLKKLEAEKDRRLWSRNRVIEQAIVRGLRELGQETRRGLGAEAAR